MQFFSSKQVSRPPDSYPKAVSNINSNSPRYSNSKLIPCCGPPWRIRSYGVAPPAGSNPTVWPCLRDRILRCGPSRRIDSLGTKKGQGHGQGQGLGQGQGSDFPWWPLSGDRTFRSGPSRRIGLSAMAPPGGLDFPMWPLPGDRTLRCGPSRRIESYGVAFPAGSTATPRDHSNIL
jgi:hypothetical protein